MKKYVVYYRVSTQRQGASGLGLEAQRTIVLNYLKKKDEILREFTEIESGKKSDRPQLAKALAYCKMNKSILLMAKLDRLARNLSFITSLQDANVDFVCCDMPEASRLTIHIFAALAEHEAQLISARTKAALEEKKKQGIKLGSPENNMTPDIILKGRHTMMNNAHHNERNRQAGMLIISLRSNGARWHTIVRELNTGGFKTRRGCKFNVTAAQRLYARYSSVHKMSN